MVGEWSFADMSPCNLPQKVATAFFNAIQGFTGNTLTPVFYVGSQIVSGTNYCIICKSTLSTNPSAGNCVIVYIYEDLNGVSAITKIEDVIS